MYAPGDTPVCKECAVGRYNDEKRQKECKDCKPGYFINENKTYNCKHCVGGQYVINAGATICDLCDVGYYGDRLNDTARTKEEMTGPPSLRKDVVVHVLNKETDDDIDLHFLLVRKDFGQKAELMPKENFSDPLPIRGAHLEESCLACNAGLFNDLRGKNSSKWCKDCPRGRWDNETGQSVCEMCLEGRFSAKLAQTSPKTCLDCGRKARCINGVCEANFDPETGCTVCIGFQMGTFPASYVRLTGKRAKLNNKTLLVALEDPRGAQTAIALFDHHMNDSGKLKFNVGEQIVVTKQIGDEWHGRIGFYGKDCWTCPSSAQSYLQDMLLMVPGVYFLFSLLYVLYRSDKSNKKSLTKVTPDGSKDADDEDAPFEMSEEDKAYEEKQRKRAEEINGASSKEGEEKDGKDNEEEKEEKKDGEEEKKEGEEEKKEGEEEKKEGEEEKKDGEEGNKDEEAGNKDEEEGKKAEEAGKKDGEEGEKEEGKDTKDGKKDKDADKKKDSNALDTVIDLEEDTEREFARKIEEKQKQREAKRALERSKINLTGTSMRRVVVSQLQLVSAVLPIIDWSDCHLDLMQDLIRVLDIIGAIFSVDIAELITSPSCGAVKTTQRSRWLLRALMPLGLAGFLLVWSVFIRIWTCKRKEAMHNSLTTILRIAVRLLLLGLYKTAVLTSLTILSCEVNEAGVNVLAMDQLPCPHAGGPDFWMALMGIFLVCLYGVVPYGMICCCLAKNGKPGKNGKYIDKNSWAYITYGWAAHGYHHHAFLWEVYNAFIVIAMSAGSELLEGEPRMFFHAGIAVFSMVMHFVFRPFEDWAGNVIVPLFCVTIILGAFSEDEFTTETFPQPDGRGSCASIDNGEFRSAVNMQLELQWGFVSMLFFTILCAMVFALKAAVTDVSSKHAKLEDTQTHGDSDKTKDDDGDDDDDDDDETFTSPKLSCCERIMLIPFLIMVAVPSIAISIVLSVVSLVVFPFLWCTKKLQELATRTEVLELQGFCFFIHKVFRISFNAVLWPVYIICFVGGHTNFRGVLDGVGLGHCLEVLGKWLWGVMFPAYEEDAAPENDVYECDHPICPFKTEEKLRLLRHHRTCEYARPFKCSQCGYRAKEEEHIRTHEAEVHGEEEEEEEHEIHVMDDDIHEIELMDSDDEEMEKEKKRKKKKKRKSKSKKGKKSKKKKKKKKKVKGTNHEGVEHSLHKDADTLKEKKRHLKAYFDVGHAAHALSGTTVQGEDLFGSDFEDSDEDGMFGDDNDGLFGGDNDLSTLEGKKDPEKVKEFKEMVDSGIMDQDTYKSELEALPDIEGVQKEEEKSGDDLSILEGKKDPEKVKEFKDMVDSGLMDSDTYKSELEALPDMEGEQTEKGEGTEDLSALEKKKEPKRVGELKEMVDNGLMDHDTYKSELEALSDFEGEPEDTEKKGKEDEQEKEKEGKEKEEKEKEEKEKADKEKADKGNKSSSDDGGGGFDLDDDESSDDSGGFDLDEVEDGGDKKPSSGGGGGGFNLDDVVEEAPKTVNARKASGLARSNTRKETRAAGTTLDDVHGSGSDIGSSGDDSLFSGSSGDDDDDDHNADEEL